MRNMLETPLRVAGPAKAPPKTPSREPLVLFEWGVSSFFGWGVYGLNLMLAWADRTDLLPATLSSIDPAALDIDPLERRRLEPALRRSADLQAELGRVAGKTANTSRLVMNVVLNGLEPGRVAHNVVLRGTPSIGVAFIEQAAFTPAASARLADYPLVIAGSQWNQTLLREAGAQNVEYVLQGVDTSHFHPAPRRNLFPGRFVVFSGGKLELRKGQDLVVRAFRRFAQRHPDALLLTAWGSPWPDLARGLPQTDLQPVPFDLDGSANLLGWTRANGVADQQVLHCGAVPNRAMARILREADVALFPNRAEGGTNLVAMESMACGVPTILSANTGHLDLLQSDGAIPLQHQRPLQGDAFRGWGESNVDEIVERLEEVYQNRDAAIARATVGAAFMSGLSWRTQMDHLAQLILPFMPKDA